jgi:hypothetical protein
VAAVGLGIVGEDIGIGEKDCPIAPKVQGSVECEVDALALVAALLERGFPGADEVGRACSAPELPQATRATAKTTTVRPASMSSPRSATDGAFSHASAGHVKSRLGQPGTRHGIET